MGLVFQLLRSAPPLNKMRRIFLSLFAFVVGILPAADADFLTIVEERLKSKVEILSGADVAALIADMSTKLAPLAAE